MNKFPMPYEVRSLDDVIKIVSEFGEIVGYGGIMNNGRHQFFVNERADTMPEPPEPVRDN